VTVHVGSFPDAGVSKVAAAAAAAAADTYVGLGVQVGSIPEAVMLTGA